jgi:hypothetical protein
MYKLFKIGILFYIVRFTATFLPLFLPVILRRCGRVVVFLIRLYAVPALVPYILFILRMRHTVYEFFTIYSIILRLKYV